MAGGGSSKSGGPSAKELFTWDDLMRDLVIVVVVVGFVYWGGSAVPITWESITSGAFFVALFHYIVGLGPDLGNTWIGLQSFLIMVAIFLLGAIFWVKARGAHEHHVDHEKFAPIHTEEIEAKEKSIQWQIVLNHLNSENPAEWKLGILEADNMLDAILEESGYRGVSLGEKLKSIDPGDLASYQDAWEAHKIRNQIAHEGSSMELSKKTARDTVARFEKVFKELGFL